MRAFITAMAAATALLMVAPAPGFAQGNSQGNSNKPAPQQNDREKKPKVRGQGNGQGQGQGQGQARGNAGRGPGEGGPPAHARARRGGPAPDVAEFNRDLFDRATRARAARNGNGRAVSVRREGGELRVVREDGGLLFALDQQVADRLGYWRMATAQRTGAADRRDREGGLGGIFDGIGDDEARTAGGAPSFCRSGEGHPVWGREWCLDKGFGLGDGDVGLWGRATDLEDVVLRAPGTRRGELDRGGLIDVLGDVVFGRLAVQSLVLGADEPLTGRWIGQQDGPRVLRVRAGDLTVAELVDGDRDDEVDVLLVNLGG